MLRDLGKICNFFWPHCLPSAPFWNQKWTDIWIGKSWQSSTETIDSFPKRHFLTITLHHPAQTPRAGQPFPEHLAPFCHILSLTSFLTAKQGRLEVSIKQKGASVVCHKVPSPTWSPILQHWFLLHCPPGLSRPPNACHLPSPLAGDVM